MVPVPLPVSPKPSDPANWLSHGPAVQLSLCDGRLYAIGGWIPATAGTSWLPRNAEGWLPVSCYLLRSDRNAVLVDTGLAIHRKHIQHGLSAALGAGQGLDGLLTRREPDTLMNLPMIARQFHLKTLRCSGPVDPFDYVEKLEQRITAGQLREMAGATVRFLQPGETFETGEFRWTPLRPAIRVLATDWFYEHTTGTLFSSDMWAFVSADEPEDPVCRTVDERIGEARLIDHLSAKFDWLIGINTDPVAEKLHADLSGFAIERICPNYGCVVEGASAVAALLANTQEALFRLKKLPVPGYSETSRW